MVFQYFTVSQYSPLYIAAYNGKKEIVEILLKKFPELINVQTVEKWLPLHAACFNAHSAVLEFLLKYKFPEEVLIQFKVPGLESDILSTNIYCDIFE